MNVFLNWSKKEIPLAKRILLTLPAGIILVGLFPWALLWGLPSLDGLLGWSPFHLPPILGWGLIAAGFPYAFWTVLDQFERARGTPLPMMPTQKLLTDGPYTWSRNPMVFGTLAGYLGVALLSGSWCSLIGVGLFSGGLLLYVKRIEERELALRFGQPYQEYRARTSFLFPWPPRRGKS